MHVGVSCMWERNVPAKRREDLQGERREALGVSGRCMLEVVGAGKKVS